MTLVKAKTNGTFFPKLVSDFLDTDFFMAPSLLDFDGGLSRFGLTAMPSANISETPKDYTIELAAPGLDKKDFKVEIDNGVLTINSEKKKEEKVEKDNYRRREFSYQSFSRSFDLPENSIPDKIDAHYENGVLKLVIPKKEVVPAKPKKEIKVG